METPRRFNSFTVALIICCVALAAAGAYVGYTQYKDIHELETTIRAEREARASEQELARARLDAASSTITDLTDQLDELSAHYEDERDRNDDLNDQVDELAGTVRDLDKLSKTDEELLQKYSRVYFLNENYVPAHLSKIDPKYILDTRNQEQYFHSQAMKYLEDMLDDARDDGIDLSVISAYRSFDEQSELKGQYTQIYGSGANTFSADQGYSEHQLGTTVDVTVPSIGGAYSGFANTEAYQWLLKNAYKYGFILSYPEGNSYYTYEPWHWRFVGEDLAHDLHKDNANFYDWDQRKIDSYLIKIFD